MSDFEIVIDTTSSRFLREVERSGNIMVDFHIHTLQGSFPSDPFLDFPVIVLSWWAEGQLSAVGANATVTNRFMSGPFWFKIDLQEVRSVISFYKDTLRGELELLPMQEMPIHAFEEHLLRAIQQVLQAVSRFGYNNSDVAALRKSYTLLGGTT